MHLEEIKSLPRKVIQNLDGDFGGLKVYLVQDFKKMSLTVNVENKAAIRLYKEKLGFDIVSNNEDEYGKGFHRYLMELDLSKVKKI